MKRSRRGHRLLVTVLALACLMNGVALPGYSLEQAKAAPVIAGSQPAKTLKQAAGIAVKSAAPPALSALSAPDESTRGRINQTYGELPLSFEINRGQSNAQVKFLARGAGYNLFLNSTEAVLALRKDEKSKRAEERNVARTSFDKRHSVTQTILRMKLVNANGLAQATGQEELPGKINYLIGNNSAKWQRSVAAYRKVKYENIYPGVDMIYYGNHKQLEYDFVVAPNADPNSIRLNFEGADKVKIDAAGELVICAGSEEIRQRKPALYQEINNTRREVAGRYILKGKREVGFEVGAYDRARPLVIDPVLVYSTYFGGSSAESYDIAVDSAGSAYVTGAANPDYPTTPGAFKTGGSLFVTKLSPDGSSFVYSAFIGGSGSNNGVDIGEGIAVDAAGNAYVTGFTSSTDFPTRNAFQEKHGGGVEDAFIAKLNAAGSDLLYSSYLGGSSFESGDRIAVDSSANAYVAGRVDSTNSSTFPTTHGALRTTPREQNPYGDGFVAKINTNASGASSLVYSTYCDARDGIAVDSSGNAYVAGGPLVLKLNATGTSLIYSFNFGNTSAASRGIAVDSSGNAYITGSTSSTAFPTRNAFQESYKGGVSDAFVAKLNPAGTALLYSTYLGGSSGDEGAGIAVDSAGNAYVTGSTGSATNFPVRNALQPTFGGGTGINASPGAPVAPSATDAFIAKINTNASGADSLLYSTYFGVNYNETGSGIAVDAEGSAYVTGFAYSFGITVAGIIHTGSTPVTTPNQANNGNLRNPFVIKLADSGARTLQFSAADYSVAEDARSAFVTVNRTGDASRATTVDYATYDGTASERSDYITAYGTLRFASGETSKSFSVLITDDAYAEGNETINLILRNPTPGTVLGVPISAVLTVKDNDATTPPTNPVDNVSFFVRQQYLDFLGREPDSTGFANWQQTLGQCPNGGYGERDNPQCDRVHVSGAFYQSTEFQTRGYFVYRFYQAGLGRRPTYAEFVRDMMRVGGAQSPEQEAVSKTDYINEFVRRQEFANKYGQPQYADAGAYVQELERVAGVTVSNEAQLIADLRSGTKTRADVLRSIAESQEVFNKYYNQAFVAMQYFGYLRRDPDQLGFNNWVQTLDASGDYRHMIFGFLYSKEYRARFGTP